MSTRQTRRKQQRRDQRRGVQKSPPWYTGPWGLAAGVVVVALAVVIIIIAGKSGPNSAADNAFPRQVAPQSVVAALEHPSQAVLASVGSGGTSNTITPAHSSTGKWVSNGLPVIFYYGGENCPYCAADRWSLISALSRFGTFSGIGLMKSASNDIYPNTNTLTFYGSNYHSPYLVFYPREVQDRAQHQLQTLTGAENSAISKLDPRKFLPLVDLANVGTASLGYDPGALRVDPTDAYSRALSWQAIADALGSASTPQAQGVFGDANRLTAAICKLTNNKPASTCSSAPIPALQKGLKLG